MSIQLPTANELMRSSKAARYMHFRNALRAALDGSSPDPKAKALAERANAAVIAMRSTPSQVHQDTALSTMSVMYGNDDFIGDLLMPTVYTGGKLSAVYFKYPRRERLAAPDDKVGDRSDVNEMNSSREKVSVSLQGRALQEWVSEDTINNQDAPLNELMDAQEQVLYGLALKREKRIAALMQSTASYGSGFYSTPSTLWDASGSTPIKDVLAGKAATWPGRGAGRYIGACSLDVYNVLREHPSVLDRVKYTGGDPALVTRQALASLFGLDDILIGAAREDTANEGQTEVDARIWGKNFIIARVAPASIRNAGFGLQFMDKPTRQIMWYDQRPGVDGGYFTKASNHDLQAVIAGDTSYLLASVIS